MARAATIQNIGYQDVHFHALKWHSTGVAQWSRGDEVKRTFVSRKSVTVEKIFLKKVLTYLNSSCTIKSVQG